jgi:hypothetical protein
MMKMKRLKMMTMYFKGVPIPLVLSEMPLPGPSWHGDYIRRRPGALLFLARFDSFEVT